MESGGSCCTKQHFINDGLMKIVHRLYFKRLYYKYVLFPTKLTCVECISVFCSAVLSCMTTVFPPNSGHLIVNNSQALLETRFLKYSPYFATLQNTISNLQFPNLVEYTVKWLPGSPWLFSSPLFQLMKYMADYLDICISPY